MLRKIFLFALSFLKVAGAIEMTDGSGQRLGLRLHRINRIGPTGAIIEVSQDPFIARSIQRYGEWELEISQFLASEILSLRRSQKVLLLDIGANVGLITLQVSEILKKRGFAGPNFSLLCIEPVSTNYDFCSRNLKKIVGEHFKWEVMRVALGDQDSDSVIHINNNNFGDSSLLPLVNQLDQREEIVQVVDAKKFSKEYLSNFDSIVLKCDTQGYDAKILARIPIEIWNLVSALVVEIESYSDIQESDMEVCLERFMNFDSCSFSSSDKNHVSAGQIREVWKSEKRVTKNLFLSRTFN
jgi:FkbM family methyltransferase